MNRKAVSEIVIVVILVAVVVSIGAMVVGWMKTYISKTKDSTSKMSYEQITCGADVTFRIWNREGTSMICMNSTSHIIYVYLDNTGIPINSFFIRLNGLINSTTEIVNTSLNQMDIKLIKINYSKLMNFSDVVIMPILIDPTNKKMRMCQDATLTISKSTIPSCQYDYAFLQTG